MKKENYYLSIIATDAVQTARAYGLGLEIAEYCTAWNMDKKFAGVDGVVKKRVEGISGCTLHAPYTRPGSLGITSRIYRPEARGVNR